MWYLQMYPQGRRCRAGGDDVLARGISERFETAASGIARELQAKAQINSPNVGADDLRRVRNFRVYYLH